MKRTLQLLTMTFAALIVLDLCVGFTLSALKDRSRLTGLTNYFDLGRSVPTKIADWKETPDSGANLFDVAGVDDIIDRSKAGFSAEELSNAQVLRNYGMSFSNRLGEAAIQLQPDYTLDSHGGPAAPANHTYALFNADRNNRRAGDIVMFGILSSSVPYITSMSNRSWAFEQPAPFTYPVYNIVNGQLGTIQPQVVTVENELALSESKNLSDAWLRQLKNEDFFYSELAFAAPWLDRSPFAKLVRRALVLRDLEDRRREALSNKADEIHEVMMTMLGNYSEMAMADGQIPIVVLIQTCSPLDINLRDFLGKDLETKGIRYIATEDFVDPTDPTKFIGDGHYVKEADLIVAKEFWEVIGSR